MTVKLGLVGTGTVGGGCIDILKNHREDFKRHYGIDVELVRVCSRNPEQAIAHGVEDIFTQDYQDILNDRSYRAIRERNPRICEAVETGMADIGAIEAAAREAGAAPGGEVPAPDAAANRFGVLMGELFVYRPDDYWADDLRTVGARLGKFVYVMDAVMDYEDDRASGSYNPLVAMDMSAEDMREDRSA